MKKTIIAILICGIMILGITGCGSSKHDVNVGYKSNVEVVKNNITLSLKEGTLKNTGATFILKNNSDITALYGNPYWIEKETDGKWSKVKTVEDMNLAFGKYRLVKDITVEYEDDSRESFNVTAEFTIEEK